MKHVTNPPSYSRLKENNRPMNAYHHEYLRNDFGNSVTCCTLQQTEGQGNLLFNQSLY